jgi:hypothetical protein
LEGWTLHRLRHSALTHDAEDGTSTPMLPARSRHVSVRSAGAAEVPVLGDDRETPHQPQVEVRRGQWRSFHWSALRLNHAAPKNFRRSLLGDVEIVARASTYQ